MKYGLKISFYWYIFITIFGLVVPSTLDKWYIVIGAIVAWFYFSFFYIGAVYNHKHTSARFNSTYSIIKIQYDPKLLIIGSLISISLSIISSRYYTGNTFHDVLTSFFSDDKSMYSRYQIHFSERGLSSFSLSKIPFIIFNAYIKLYLVFIAIYYFVYCNNKTILVHLSFILGTISYLYFSTSRGTSFEIFELVILYVFAYFLLLDMRGAKLSLRQLSKIVILTMAAFFAYSYNITSRFASGEARYCITNDLCRASREESFFANFAVYDTFFALSAYFSVGIYKLAIFVHDILVDGMAHVVSGFLPLGFAAILNLDMKQEICSRYFDCGATWHPDLLVYIESFGLFGTACLLYGFGRILAYTYKKISAGVYPMAHSILAYFIILSVISAPVGNFVATSSASLLVIIIVASFLFLSNYPKR